MYQALSRGHLAIVDTAKELWSIFHPYPIPSMQQLEGKKLYNFPTHTVYA
jgi:hypothetical protein